MEKTFGSRAEVWHGTAKKTNGGLLKSDLLMNKHGRIVSKRKHNTAKREKRLVKAGFLTKKGHFGFIKKGKGSRHMKGGTGATTESGMMYKGSHHMAMPIKKGGSGMMHKSSHHMAMPIKKGGRGNTMKMMKGGMYALSPSSFDGQGVGTSGAGLQLMATNMN